MSNFYTSVEKYGSNILWRGYENGRPFMRKKRYEPKLFISTKDTESEYTTLIGNRPLKPKQFDSMNDAREFVEQYKDVSGFDLCGNVNFVHQFVQEKYPGDIKFDMSQINICSYDIEYDSTGTEKYDDNHLIKVRKKS